MISSGPPAQAALIASESVGSLLTLNNRADVSLMIFGQQNRQAALEDRSGSVKQAGVGLLKPHSTHADDNGMKPSGSRNQLQSPSFQNAPGKGGIMSAANLGGITKK